MGVQVIKRLVVVSILVLGVVISLDDSINFCIDDVNRVVIIVRLVSIYKGVNIITISSLVFAEDLVSNFLVLNPILAFVIGVYCGFLNQVFLIKNFRTVEVISEKMGYLVDVPSFERMELVPSHLGNT